MNVMTCEAVTDFLPDRLAERLGEVDRIRVDQHLAACADCRAQRDLLEVLRAAAVTVPAGLEMRVRRAVAARPQPRRWAPAHMAVAASVVFALAAGALFLSEGPRTGRRSSSSDPGIATLPTGSYDDPLLHGGPGLGQLSVDELERLLAELDS
jgi:predicted anti-sigma-YlaC factor YlaD